MATEVGREERTVRKWGDEDDPAEINLSASIALDILFQRHGGEGRPLYDVYGLKVGAAMAQVCVADGWHEDWPENPDVTSC